MKIRNTITITLILTPEDANVVRFTLSKAIEETRNWALLADVKGEPQDIVAQWIDQAHGLESAELQLYVHLEDVDYADEEGERRGSKRYPQ